MLRRRRARLILRLLLLPAVLLTARLAPAQSTEPTTGPTTEPSTNPTTAPASRPARRIIAALTNLASGIEQTNAQLKQADVHVAADRVTTNIEQDLGNLTTEISARLQEGPNLGAAAPSLDELRSEEHDLGDIR